MKWALMPYGFTGCECARYAARGLAIGLAAATAVAWALHQATALARFLFCVLSSYPCMKARFLTLNAIWLGGEFGDNAREGLPLRGRSTFFVAIGAKGGLQGAASTRTEGEHYA